MSASLFRKALNNTIQVTTSRHGSRSVADRTMELEDRGNQPRVIPTISNRDSRGGYRGRGYRDYRQHDDRDGMSITQRLGERMRGRGRGDRGRGRGLRFNGRGRGRGRGRGGSRYRVLDDKGEPPKGKNWYQITIPFGASVDKTFIVNSILELLDTKDMVPVCYKEEGKSATFFMEITYGESEALKAVSKRISMPNGFKMAIIVRQSDPPIPKTLDGPLLDKLTEVLSSLYDAENRVLNLKQFHTNRGLAPECLPINRPAVMSAIVKIIKQHIPEVRAIDVSKNRLTMLDSLANVVESTPDMTALDISDNDVRDYDLEKLRGWNLTKICVANTTFANRIPTTTALLSAVRKIFPKILQMNGVDAPPLIDFDLGQEDSKLPPIRGNFLGANQAIQDIIIRFLKQYYELFDSDDRAQLLPAYHKAARFSTSFYFNPNIQNRQSRFNLEQSRNLLKLESSHQRERRLKTSALSIIAYFSDSFPKSKHLLESFTVDIVNQTEETLTFTVTGIYEEANASKMGQQCRFFSRTFTTVPQGEGIVILSELLCLTNIDKIKKDKILNTIRDRPVTAPVNQPESSAAAAPVEAAAPTDAALGQAAMIREFMEKSGMNEHWSTECLKANNFDFQKSAEMFYNLKTESKIPADAFQ